MTRVMTIQARDFDAYGYPRHIVWWLNDLWMEWSTPFGWTDLPTNQQVRELGAYICRSVKGAYIEVRLCWHYGLNCVQVDAYAETDRDTGRWTGGLYSHHDTLPDATQQARLWVRELHGWLNKGGDCLLTRGNQYGVSVSPRKAESIRREISRLELQRERLAAKSGHGSNPAGSNRGSRATRIARREWIGERLHKLRLELEDAL